MTVKLFLKKLEIINFSFSDRVQLTLFLPFSPTEAYPVDILEDDPEGHQAATQVYYDSLREGAQASSEVFSLPTGEQVCLMPI